MVGRALIRPLFPPPVALTIDVALELRCRQHLHPILSGAQQFAGTHIASAIDQQAEPAARQQRGYTERSAVAAGRSAGGIRQPGVAQGLQVRGIEFGLVGQKNEDTLAVCVKFAEATAQRGGQSEIRISANHAAASQVGN